eukprot:TRINITY_DN1829_c0_g1_i2.p1 TRINITY_DN1829_c0_g1~~TRINITY_DN1829_c0_g1_i2.p1  ORF type:complete len:408 (-),score=57.74 TRINITY_DN1829_c0_g1_i2:964-2187(-)
MTAKPDSTAALAHIIKAPMRKALVAMKAAALGHIMDVGVDSIKLESDRFITKLKAENARLTSQITEARAGIHNASRVAVQHRAAVRAATLLNEVSEQRFLLEQRANDLALQLQQIKFQAEDLAARLPESTNNILDMKDSIAEAEGELAQTESESRHLAALLHKMSRQKDVRDVRLASLRQSADAQRRDAEFLNHTCGQAQTDLQHTNNELLEIQNDIDEQRRNAEHVIAERQRQLTHQQELIQQYLQQRSRAHSNVDAVGLGLDGDALMDRYAVAFKRLREICNTDTVDAILQRLQRQKDIEVEYTTKRGAVTQRAAALAEEKVHNFAVCAFLLNLPRITGLRVCVSRKRCYNVLKRSNIPERSLNRTIVRLAELRFLYKRPVNDWRTYPKRWRHRTNSYNSYRSAC